MTTDYFFMKSEAEQAKLIKASAYKAGILKVGEEFTCQECGDEVPAHTVNEIDNVWCHTCLWADD